MSEKTSMDKYVSIINSQLEKKKGEENLEELRTLFTTKDFIETIKSQRIDINLRAERKTKKTNRRVEKLLLEEINTLLLTDELYENENIEFFYFYLKREKAKRENVIVFWITVMVVLLVMTGFFVFA